MTWAASVSVCATVTGPVPSAATAATVRASTDGVEPVVTTLPRTNSSREPSGDQVGSKSSQPPS